MTLRNKPKTKTMKTQKTIVASALLFLGGLTMASAQGTAFTYQGRLTDGTNPANGTFSLRFALYEVLDGGNGVGPPLTNNAVAVAGGLFTVPLDFGGGVFIGPARWLEIGVRTNGSAGPHTPLSPRQSLTPAPYAVFAATASSVPNRSIGSAQLADSINLGDASLSGRLDVYRTVAGTPAISLIGGFSEIITYRSDGLEQIRLAGDIGGEILLHNNMPNDSIAVALSAYGSQGGRLLLLSSNGLQRVTLWGGNNGGTLSLSDSSTLRRIFLDGSAGDIASSTSFSLVDVIGGSTWATIAKNGAGGGVFRAYDESANLTAAFGSSTGAGGFVQLYQANDNIGVKLDGDATGTSGGGSLNVHASDGSSAVLLSGSSRQITTYGDAGEVTAWLGSGATAGGFVQLYQANGNIGAKLDGDSTGTSGGGSLGVRAPDGSTAVYLSGNYSGGGGIYARNTNGNNRALLAGQSTGGGGGLFLYDGNGTSTVALNAAENSTTGSQLVMKQANGTTTIQLDAEFNAGGGGFLQLSRGDGTAAITLRADATGEGKITTQVLQITGGADLSEQFEIKAANEAPQPGMIVCIDPETPGQLITSSKAYDRTVAGVMSGAGGVKPGMLMGQAGTAADGKHPVALTGRVYCEADASNGPIHPGDLLTTSSAPGHAMKVTDYPKAQGAIIGKAMSRLDKGKGLVLVLVSLQ